MKLIILTFSILLSPFLLAQENIYRIDIILFKFLPNLESKEKFKIPEAEFGENLFTLSSMKYPEFIDPLTLDLNYQFEELFIEISSPEIIAREETDSKSVTKPENRKFFEIDIGEKFSLASEVESFEKSRDYRVIGHFSWFQPIAEEDSSIPLLIETDKFKGSKIFGTLNVYKKRFLHSDFNFFLADEVEESESQELRLFLTRESPEEYVILSKEDSMKLNYQLKQSRKLKSGELHYIDHPKFGIIYRIVKTEKIEQS